MFKALKALRVTQIAVATATLMALSGCAEIFYRRIPTGTFSGKLSVEWVAPNQFMYKPDPVKPLTYVTSDGLVITPKTMFTDGGSIPRLLWSAPGFGPWDFGPGYILHDWLFEQHHCQTPGWEQVDFERSASLLAEAMKTQLEKTGANGQAHIVYAVYEAVSSPVARTLWDQGSCHPPPSAAPRPEGGGKSIQLLIIDAGE